MELGHYTEQDLETRVSSAFAQRLLAVTYAKKRAEAKALDGAGEGGAVDTGANPFGGRQVPAVAGHGADWRPEPWMTVVDALPN